MVLKVPVTCALPFPVEWFTGKTAKSAVQLGVASTSKLYLAGDMPAATPPVPRGTLQSRFSAVVDELPPLRSRSWSCWRQSRSLPLPRGVAMVRAVAMHFPGSIGARLVFHLFGLLWGVTSREENMPGTPVQRNRNGAVRPGEFLSKSWDRQRDRNQRYCDRRQPAGQPISTQHGSNSPILHCVLHIPRRTLTAHVST